MCWLCNGTKKIDNIVEQYTNTKGKVIFYDTGINNCPICSDLASFTSAWPWGPYLEEVTK